MILSDTRFGEATNTSTDTQKKAADVFSWGLYGFLVFSIFQWPRFWGVPKKGG